MTPIYATSTYVQPSPGEHLGYEYSRTQNPTRKAYEDCMASLEKGEKGFAFASGMAAISAIIDTLPVNSHIIAMNDLYGGTFRLFDKVRRHTSGLEVDFIDLNNEAALTDAIKENTRLIWAETPTNPMLSLVDIASIANIAKHHNIKFVVDNTFATPYIQQPLTMGADIVVHSATKYLNGHSDVVNGIVIVGNDQELQENLAFVQNSVGGVCGPFDSFLVLRSLKTLGLRMRQHCQSAQIIAEHLEQHPKVKRVYYPGLESHPQHQLAKQQMHLPGGMVSIELNGDLADAKRMLESTHLFALAESLGGVESLIEHPAIMTHASVDPKLRQALGISDTLIRLSVGIEDVSDLIEDLEEALRS
jgi:cystathionine beta-lyase/cystathionine gamma-synthase